MEVNHIIGKSNIKESEKEEQVKKILELLKNKKQTYAVNKFVLEETIKRLKETIV